ncbi:hypothetical protein [Brevibacterium linens]
MTTRASANAIEPSRTEAALAIETKGHLGGWVRLTDVELEHTEVGHLGEE